MNMNRSGHSEMQDPEWYRLNADRAKLSPSNLETESLQNSLTSLNLDSFTVTAELQDHYSVRSLPVLSSNTSFAAAADAPWNESPRSMRQGRGGRSRVPKMNPTMSPLDQLQNSISSLTYMTRAPPLTSIITEPEEDLNGSLASLNLLGTNTEMDATAHAGNVRRAPSSQITPPPCANPVSPVRSMRSQPTQSSSPYRYSGDVSYAGSSITSQASTLYRGRTYSTTDEPSLSTLGDDDYEEEDDDNLEIIKLLRNQVETLKSQLIAEQEKNQELKLQHRNMRPHSFISSSSRSFAYDNSSDNDSFGCDDHHSVTNPISSKNTQKLSEAETGITKSISSLKESLRRRQDTTDENDEDEEFLMDELVICELENHFKVMTNQHKAKLHDMMEKNKELKNQNDKFENHILELEKNQK